MAQNCPQGFDCVLLNSCPNYYVSCPSGWFCSSYEGFQDESEMDYQYALLKEKHTDVDVTRSNAYLYIDPNRAIQNQCLNGFYCTSPTKMVSCPAGYWCSEATVEPRKCGVLSICPKNSYYEIDLTNLLLAMLISITMLSISTRAGFVQRRKESISRNKLLFEEHDADNAVNKFVNKGHSPPSYSVAIELDRVCYAPKEASTPILSNISSFLPAGKMTLVLGTSGSGKTTLLNMIRTGGAKLTSGKVNFMLQKHETERSFPGKFFDEGFSATSPTEEQNYSDIMTPFLSKSESINSPDIKELHALNLSQCIGFVPQDDILDRSLTVREYLLFHALCRSQQPLSISQAHPIVETTLNDLGIMHIADTVIGGGENAAANISGGQLKRVNIACELVAISAPGVLLLDEPTSGLDAAVAFDLLKSIEQLKSSLGVTIVCVLQQPRHEIFLSFDHLLLLHPNGSLVFAGKPQDSVYFLKNTLHYQPYSQETSDADFCIDVLNEMKNENELDISI